MYASMKLASKIFYPFRRYFAEINNPKTKSVREILFVTSAIPLKQKFV